MGLSAKGPSEQARQALAAFPSAVAGQQRWVIWLDTLDDSFDETSLLVQLRVGLSVLVDGVNHYNLAGGLHCRSVSGWGYDSYHYEGESQVASTRIAAKAGVKTERVVCTVPLTIAYNCRLPLVVYTPDNLQVLHRVLQAQSDFQTASVG